MSSSETIRLLREMLALLKASNAPAPSPEPERSEPEPRATEQPGIDMNDIRRSVPRPKPPRAPGQQQLRHNGRWGYY